VTDTTILKERVRTFSKEGREFVVSYQLGTRINRETACYLIRAYLKEKSARGQEKETGSFVELPYPYGQISERIFDLISNASDPVFPVHLPEIVRDELSATLILETGPHFWP